MNVYIYGVRVLVRKHQILKVKPDVRTRTAGDTEGGGKYKENLR